MGCVAIQVGQRRPESALTVRGESEGERPVTTRADVFQKVGAQRTKVLPGGTKNGRASVAGGEWVRGTGRGDEKGAQIMQEYVIHSKDFLKKIYFFN